jgi:hypothetical protein
MSYCSCACGSCRVNALCWPLIVLAAGILFSLDLIWHVWPIWKTWPALLIVAGLCKLAARLAPAAGHGMAPPPADTPGRVPLSGLTGGGPYAS